MTGFLIIVAMLILMGIVASLTWHMGLKHGMAVRQRETSLACEHAVRLTMSPTARAIWRHVDGDTTYEEMMKELEESAGRTKEFTANELIEIADKNMTDLEGTLEIWMGKNEDTA